VTATATAGSAATAPAASTASAERRTPFARLAAVELRKMGDTRAGFWLLAALGLVIVAVTIVYGVTADGEDLTLTEFFRTIQWPVGLLLPVLAILSVTSEWSQRTGLTTFTLVPDRWRVVAAKIAATTALAAASVVTALVVAAIGNLVAGGDGSWALSPATVVEGFVFQLAGMTAGLAFGLVLQASAPALVTYYVLPTAFTVLVSLVDDFDGPADWVDTGRTLVPLVEGAVSGTEWARIATSLTLWVLLPLAVGLWRLPRGEVK
jgi:hypothetical protein